MILTCECAAGRLFYGDIVDCGVMLFKRAVGGG